MHFAPNILYLSDNFTLFRGETCFCLKEQFTCGKLNWKLLKRSSFASALSIFRRITHHLVIYFNENNLCIYLFFYLIRTVGNFLSWLFVSSANIMGAKRGGGDKRKMKTKTAEREQRERDEFMSWWWISRRRLLFLCTSCKFVNANDVVIDRRLEKQRTMLIESSVCVQKGHKSKRQVTFPPIFCADSGCFFLFLCALIARLYQISAAQCC